jgi:hypothetical protein
MVFTRSRHWSLSWTSSIQSIPPNLVPLRFIFILPSHLRRGFSCDFFLWFSYQNHTYVPIFSKESYIPCPSNPIWLNHYNYTRILGQNINKYVTTRKYVLKSFVRSAALNIHHIRSVSNKSCSSDEMYVFHYIHTSCRKRNFFYKTNKILFELQVKQGKAFDRYEPKLNSVHNF